MEVAARAAVVRARAAAAREKAAVVRARAAAAREKAAAARATAAGGEGEGMRFTLGAS
jgi:hypothetical protein